MCWYKLVKIFALLIFEVVSYTDCSDLVLSPYPYKSGLQSDLNRFPAPNPLILDTETEPYVSGKKTFGVIMSPPVVPDDDTSSGYQTKAFSCSLIPCLQEDLTTAVCACNYNTGNVVTFKNNCDVKKHNCRFDTSFKVILEEICPWEYESRRSNKQLEVDYNDPKYYNK